MPEKKKKKLLDGKTWERDGRLVEAATALGKELGNGVFEDYNLFLDKVDDAIKKLNIKLTGSEQKFLMRAVSYRVETAPPVIAKVHRAGKAKVDPLHGLYANPPDEQAAIVRFLDHANRKIDGFIRAKRKRIGLLNEQKQAIIHRAVTCGLNPNVPHKPSGIPWLGDIPKHWGIVRNMGLFSHRVEPGITGLAVLQVSLRSGITAEELDQFGRPKRLIANAIKYKRIHKGDMAYNTMRMWQGAVGVSPSDGLVSPAYVVLKPRQDTCPEFYDFIFHTEVYKQQVNRQSTGIVSDRNRLYWDSFKQMPNLTLHRSEQEEIVNFIATETTALTTAISRTEREIALMQECRTRLTADIVTGKLDVRVAAAKLPEVREVSEPAEDDVSVNDDCDDEVNDSN